MSENTEQSVRAREDREQELAILICKARGRDPFQMTYHTVEPGVMEPFGDAWCHYIVEARAVLDWHEAEARGAAEQRRKDGELSLAKLFCQNEQDASDRTPERADVVQWQKDRNEFFLSSTLEVVTEYAAWRDKKDAEGQEPVAWVPVHPKHGNLWTMTTDTPNRERLPHEYPLAPLYTHPANVAMLEARVKELEEAKGKKQEEARRYRNALMNICEKTSEFSISHKVARAALTREGRV